MQQWLSTQKVIPFDKPESFSEYDPAKKACKEKLSEAIIEASREFGEERDVIGEDGKRSIKLNALYSKGTHTPNLLQQIRPEIVSNKCPLFKKFFIYLSAFCSSR